MHGQVCSRRVKEVACRHLGRQRLACPHLSGRYGNLQIDLRLAIPSHLDGQVGILGVEAAQAVNAGGQVLGQVELPVSATQRRKWDILAIQLGAVRTIQRQRKSAHFWQAIAPIVGLAHDGTEINHLPRAVDRPVAVQVDL